MLQVETGVENIGNLVLRQRSTSVTSALIASLRSGCADPGGGADIASECITSRAFVKFRETMEFPWEFPCEFVNFHGWIFLFIFLWWSMCLHPSLLVDPSQDHPQGVLACDVHLSLLHRWLWPAPFSTQRQGSSNGKSLKQHHTTSIWSASLAASNHSMFIHALSMQAFKERVKRC